MTSTELPLMRHPILMLTTLALFVIDQIAKAYLSDAVWIKIVGSFYLAGLRNTEPTTYPVLVHAVGIAVCLALVFYLTRRWESRAFVWGFWCILFGNLGNLVNAWWPGYWVDYLEIYPIVAFNLADVMIYGGFGLVGVGVFGTAWMLIRNNTPTV